MRILSVAMVFLMLFAIAIPGVAFADEPEEAVNTVEEPVDSNDAEDANADQEGPDNHQKNEGKTDDGSFEDDSPTVIDKPVDDVDAGVDENAGDQQNEDENEEETNEEETDTETILDKINQGLSLETDIEVEEQRATVTATASNATEYELTNGVFSFHLEGYEPKVKQKGNEATAVYKKLAEGKYDVTVKYQATVVLAGKAYQVTTESVQSFRVTQDPVEVTIGAWHYYQGNEDILELHAYLEEADHGKGTWTFAVDGQQETVYTEDDLYADAWFELSDPQPGKRYEAQISFEGEAEGKKASGSTTYSFQLVVPTLDYACTEKGVEMVTNLKGAKSAEGEWFFGLLDWEKEEWADEHYSDWVEGTTYKHTFKKVKPGSYDLYVDYFGDVDGEEFWTWFYEELEVKAGDPCAAAVAAPKPGDGGSGEKPDTGETVTPKQPKQVTGEINQGAAIPKTSIQEPLGILIGVCIMLLGVGLYLIRRRSALS